MEEQTIYRECTGVCCPRHCHVVATWRYSFASHFKEFVLSKVFFFWMGWSLAEIHQSCIQRLFILKNCSKPFKICCQTTGLPFCRNRFQASPLHALFTLFGRDDKQVAKSVTLAKLEARSLYYACIPETLETLLRWRSMEEECFLHRGGRPCSCCPCASLLRRGEAATGAR